jgi:hypothetical protein
MLMLLAAAAMQAADAQASPSATHQDRANRYERLCRREHSVHGCPLRSLQELRNAGESRGGLATPWHEGRA